MRRPGAPPSAGVKHPGVLAVPRGASGTVDVSLLDVTLAGDALSGLWIEDPPHASNAGIALVSRGSTITGSGFRPGPAFADFDGVRVNEGGGGDLSLVVHDSRVVRDAADGVELEEQGAGDVRSLVHGSRFDDSGDQPQNPDDLEDGFDVDEAGSGSIVAAFVRASVNGNEDEGIDLDEEGTGDIRGTMLLVVTLGNLDAGISYTEDGLERAGGDVEFVFTRVDASDARDGDGIEVEEFGGGDMRGTILGSTVSRNHDDGIQAQEDDAGKETLHLRSVVVEGSGDDAVNADGVEVDRR